MAYLGFTGISGVAAVTALSTGHWLAWIFPAFLCAWSLRFFVKRRSRIRFSSANLKVDSCEKTLTKKHRRNEAHLHTHTLLDNEQQIRGFKCSE